MIFNPVVNGGGGNSQKYAITDRAGYGLPSEAQAGEIVTWHIDQYMASVSIRATQALWKFGDTDDNERTVPYQWYSYELPGGRGSGTYIGFIMPPSDVIVSAN